MSSNIIWSVWSPYGRWPRIGIVNVQYDSVPETIFPNALFRPESDRVRLELIWGKRQRLRNLTPLLCVPDIGKTKVLKDLLNVFRLGESILTGSLGVSNAISLYLIQGRPSPSCSLELVQRNHMVLRNIWHGLAEPATKHRHFSCITEKSLDDFSFFPYNT